MASADGPELPEGRTAWRKAAVVAVPALVAAAAMAVAMAQGVLASSMAVSGRTFQVSAGRLSSKGLASFVDVPRAADGSGHAGTLLSIGDATLSDICQAARVKTPLGTVVFKLTAGGGAGSISAGRLVLDADELTGDARFGEAEVGRDASTLDRVPGARGEPGQFGFQAADVSVTGVKSQAWSATGGSLRLKGLRLKVSLDGPACF